MVLPRLLGEVIEGLRGCQEVEAILLGGSRGVGGVPDRASDWNLSVCLSAPLSAEVRKALLAPRSTVLEQDPVDSELRDSGELNDGTVFDLVYRDLDTFVEGVRQIVEDERASLGYSTCLWHALATSHLLFDRTGRATTAQKRFSVPYPEGLRRAIVARNWPSVADGILSFRSQASKALARGDWVAVQLQTEGYLASAFDLVFAANRQLHPGRQRLLERSQALAQLPSDWMGLLGAVDRAVGVARQTLPDALGRLSLALEGFLVRQGLRDHPTGPLPKAPPTPRSSTETPVVAPRGPLTVFTDGGCIGNPGKGAWAYLIEDGNERREDTAGELLTTNNKMELQAVIEALTAIHQASEWKGRPIRIHTDSQYVRNGITSWIKTWSANGWKTAAKEPVKNQELWVELQKWDALLKPEWKWVKGHAGNPNNERCDRLVRRTMDQL